MSVRLWKWRTASCIETIVAVPVPSAVASKALLRSPCRGQGTLLNLRPEPLGDGEENPEQVEKAEDDLVVSSQPFGKIDVKIV